MTSTQLSFSPGILRLSGVTAVHDLYFDLRSSADADSSGGIVCITATELLGQPQLLPHWARDAATRYLVLRDTHEALLMRIPEILGLRRPSSKVHVTSDPDVAVRLLIAQHRRDFNEAIVDAYLLQTDLLVVLGNLAVRSFPIRGVEELKSLPRESLEAFEIDKGGSFIHWPAADLHLGIAQFLQQVDPSYLADLEIARYAVDTTALSLISMRESRNLRQADIPGLSERQIRRLEKGVSRLTLDAAEKLAAAFGQSLSEFLDEFSQWASQMTSHLEGERDGDTRERDAAVLATKASE